MMTTFFQAFPTLAGYLLHIDQYLFNFVSTYGFWTYAALFAVIFCETGIVIMPFLPGDSLLFVAGSIAAQTTQVLTFEWLLVLLIFASILGNQVNYLIGKWLGPHLFNRQSRFFQLKHLKTAHEFYEKHGGKAIILARFLPIIRTMVPFVAGLSAMSVSLYSFYNVLSAIIWIGSLLTLGYFFGSLPLIKDNFSLVIYGLILLSILPTMFMFIYRRVMKQS